MIMNVPKSHQILPYQPDRTDKLLPSPLLSRFSLRLSDKNPKCKVLVVDDDPLFLDLTKRNFEKTDNIQVICCKSARDAISVTQNTSIDIIVSDYDMPEMNGIQYLSWLRESGFQTPFILCTGRGREEVIIEALNCGASYYISKGCDPKSLYAELCNVISQISSGIRYENDIREKEHLIGSIFQHLPDPTYAVDLNGKVIAWNHAMEKLSGISGLQAEGTDYYRTSYPFSHVTAGLPIDLVLGMTDTLSEPFVLLLQTPDMVMSEIRITNSAHEIEFYWIKTTSLSSESGLVLGAIESIRDVTAEKKSEYNIRAKSLYYRNLVELHVDPLITLDEDLTISDLNIAAEEIIGESGKDIIGTPFSLFFREADMVEKICNSIMSLSQQVRDIPLHMVTKSGVKSVNFFGVPCMNDHVSGVKIFVELHEIFCSETGQPNFISEL
jgi:CheY-like chemotaxis protein